MYCAFLDLAKRKPLFFFSFYDHQFGKFGVHKKILILDTLIHYNVENTIIKRFAAYYFDYSIFVVINE